MTLGTFIISASIIIGLADMGKPGGLRKYKRSKKLNTFPPSDRGK